MPGVEVRLLQSFAEYRQCERIQRRVWGAVGVTREIMSAMQKHRGLIIGTIVEGKVVGFILAFLASYHGDLVTGRTSWLWKRNTATRVSASG
jgi:predicted GNAT superfamily acetyltransferase